MESIRQCLMRHIQEKRLTGAAYAISVDGNILCREALGYADCEQSRPLGDGADLSPRLHDKAHHGSGCHDLQGARAP